MTTLHDRTKAERELESKHSHWSTIADEYGFGSFVHSEVPRKLNRIVITHRQFGADEPTGMYISLNEWRDMKVKVDFMFHFVATMSQRFNQRGSQTSEAFSAAAYPGFASVWDNTADDDYQSL